MARKELFKSLIALSQAELPFERIEREIDLPVQPELIITVPGVRRAGKSSLLMLTVNKLLASGVKREQILWVNFDDERLDRMPTEELDEVLQAYREMYPEIELKDVYMFFDEIQNIDGWDLFVLRVFKSYCRNVYVTGSNAKLLSSEISTALRGWTLDYEMLPLSFREFCRFKGIYETTFATRLFQYHVVPGFGRASCDKKHRGAALFPQARDAESNEDDIHQCHRERYAF